MSTCTLTRRFAVLVSDAERLPVPQVLEVSAISADEARRVARAELARHQLDDASVLGVRAL